MSTPFGLATGPLYRFRLVRIAAGHHLLPIVGHHIICDGWPLGLFNAEVSDAYALARGGACGGGGGRRQPEGPGPGCADLA